MRYSLASILFLAGIDTCHGLKESRSDCLSKCIEPSSQASEDNSLNEICHDLTKQRNMFICISRLCQGQYYGLALSQAIVSCNNLGADIAALHPIQIKEASSALGSLVLPRQELFVGNEFDALDPVFVGNGFSLSVTCQAGSDGVVTIQPSTASLEPRPPNLEDLPGGHRGPTTPEGRPELQPAMTMTTEGEFSSGVCHTCSITPPSGSSLIELSEFGTSTLELDPSASTLSAFGSGGKQSSSAASSATDNMAHGANESGASGCTSSTLSPAMVDSSTPCGCPTTTTTPSSSMIMTTATTTPCSTTSTSRLILNSSSSTPCSSTTELKPTVSLPSIAIESTTQEKELNSSTSCETLARQTGFPTTTSLNNTMLETQSITPTADVHFPKKPSDTPCSFTNTTAISVTQTSAVSFSAAKLTPSASSSPCSTTDTSSSTTCTTSSQSTSSRSKSTQASLISSISSTHTPTVKPTIQLQEYTTTSTPPLVGYSTSSKASIDAYDAPPAYSFSAAVVSSSSATSSPTSTVLLESTKRPRISSKSSVKALASSLPAYDTLETGSSTSESSITAEVIPTTALSSLHSTSSSTRMTRSASTQATTENPFMKTLTSTLTTRISTSEQEKRSQESSYETLVATKPGHRPTALFVTIITADDAGDLQTSVLAVQEQSPWASIAPRILPNHAILGNLTTPTAVESAVVRPHAAMTATINSTLSVTVTETAAGTATDALSGFKTSNGLGKYQYEVAILLGQLVIMIMSFLIY